MLPINFKSTGNTCYSCNYTCESVNSIKCNSFHSMCEICSESYLKMCLSEPEYKFPVICTCKSEFDFETVQFMLKMLNIQEKFNNLLTRKSLKQNENEVIVECPFCDYMEIRDALGINFIYCKNPICSKTSCYYCHLECKDDLIEDTEQSNSDINMHFECAQNGYIKAQIEKAIENGSIVKCPFCNTGSRKEEDSCTHMNCNKCEQNYCYVCGLACKNFSTYDENGNDANNFVVHNDAWKFEENCCPMYLNDIYEIDNRWPDSGNESELLDFFHRKRILKNLRDVFELNDINFIKELENKYKWLEKADLTIDEILNEDLELIKRKPYDDY